MDTLLKNYINSGLITHHYWALGFAQNPEPHHSSCFLPGGRSVFDLASLTKALVTVPILWKKKDQWSEPLGSLWDECPGALSHLTLESLLSHQSGLPAWKGYVFWALHQRKPTLTRWFQETFPQTLLPPQTYRYSDVGYLLLGAFLGQDRLTTLWEELSLPLGLPFTYGPIPKEMAISTGYCPLRRRFLEGEVHDENAWALGGTAPHAGLFSSGPDLWLGLHRLIHSDYFSSFFQNPLGWQVGNQDSRLIFQGEISFGHLGFTGTAFWYEPKSDRLAIFLTNRVISGRLAPWMGELRRQVYAKLGSLPL
jgi:CubicO group peptidase (beta-lactamase class C family)